MASHDQTSAELREAGGSAPMPAPPTSSDHEHNKSGGHAKEHDSEFAPNSSEPSKESNTVVVDHSETTNAKKSDDR